jgi:outer membrane receptor protein involved in Fe transport
LGDSSTQHFRRAKNTTNLSIGKKYGMFNSKAQIIKKSSTIESNNTILKGKTLVNLGTNYKINSKTKLSLNINNAFDKKYIPATGFSGDFNNAGRVIKIGVTYNF